ncbi:hypothetical protein J4E91_005869 [Alternaria rosae]|nr:hypothetical protein J4E91_005869 [Alternaria rosae]
MSRLSTQQLQLQWLSKSTPEQRQQWYNKATPEEQQWYILQAQRLRQQSEQLQRQQQGQQQQQQQQVPRQNSRHQGQNAARSPSINSLSRPRSYTSSPLSATSMMAPAVRAPRTAISPTRSKNTATLSAVSYIPTVPRSALAPNAGGIRHHQQNSAFFGSTQTQPRMLPTNDVARYQKSPPKQQGRSHVQMKLPPSPTRPGSSPSAHAALHPATMSQKRRATNAPDGAVHADKRQNTMPCPAAPVAPIGQNNDPLNPGPYNRMRSVPVAAANGVGAAVDRINTDDINRERRMQQNKLAEQRARQQQAYDAEKAHALEVYNAATAAALKREQDDARREFLRKDPSANYRHILEVYALSPLDPKKGEYPNRYLTSLLANRVMPMDLDCDLALAIVYAKDRWDYFGQWPKDIERFAGYERKRKEKAARDRA